MDRSQISVFENFQIEKDNKVISHYQIIITAEAIYLINSNNDYGGFVKNIFSGVGDVLGLFGDAAGVVGGLASQLTGHKLSKMLTQFSENRSKSQLEKVLKNLDKYAATKDGIEQISFEQLKQVTIKKGYVLNGSSYLIFESNIGTQKIFSKERANVEAVAKTIKTYAPQVKVVSKMI